MADAGILKRRAAGLEAASRILDVRHGTGVPKVARAEVINAEARAIVANKQIAYQLAPAASMNAAIQNSYFGRGAK